MKITISFETSEWYLDWSTKVIDLLRTFGVCTNVTVIREDK